MRPFTRPIVPVFFAAAALLLAIVTNAPASAAQLESGPFVVDVMEVYLDVVNMNRCCDCHTTIC